MTAKLIEDQPHRSRQVRRSNSEGARVIEPPEAPRRGLLRSKRYRRTGCQHDDVTCSATTEATSGAEVEPDAHVVASHDSHRARCQASLRRAETVCVTVLEHLDVALKSTAGASRMVVIACCGVTGQFSGCDKRP